ncbi:MAG: hypothetical protein KGI26_02030 [Thaumarchaeota archaeon]|nr:hypothetical protein [Nitrososphaerota archaeon]
MAGPVFLGYFLYLAAVLVPGYGLGELAGKWHGNDDLVRRLGYAVGYGIVVDTVVDALRTLGVRFAGLNLLGMDQYVLYFTVILGIVFLSVSYAWRKKLAGLPGLTREGGGVLACTAVVAVIAWLYFAKYPIFPPYYNPDFLAIVGRPLDLIYGTQGTIPRLLLYGAGYYQAAAAFLAAGSSSLAVAETAMALLAILSPAVVYAVTADMLGDRRAGLFASSIYALSGTVWAQMVFADGLYPNFVGVLLELVLLVTFLDFVKGPRTWPLWTLSTLVTVAAYFSHYTVLAVFGTFAIMTAAAALFKRSELRRTLGATLVFVLPGALGALVFTRQFNLAVLISYLSGSNQPPTTFLSSALAFFPSAAYLAFSVRNDIGLIAMLTLLTVALYRSTKLRDQSILLPAIWFFALMLAAPQNGSAWRFALEAVMPLTILAGYGLNSIIPKSRSSKRDRLRRGDPYRFGLVVLTVLFLTPIVATGWSSSFVQNITTGAGTEAAAQGQVNATMTWLDRNTAPSASFLSVTTPTFLYTVIQIDRNCTYEYFGNESRAITFARQNGDDYILVTRHGVFYDQVTPVADDSAPSLPWFTYKPTAGLALVYNNTEVKVFQLDGQG